MVNGNGNAFIQRIFYVHIFKCALQHFVGAFGYKKVKAKLYKNKSC